MSWMCKSCDYEEHVCDDLDCTCMNPPCVAFREEMNELLESGDETQHDNSTS